MRSGIWFSCNFFHVTHFRSTFFTVCLIFGIQKFCRSNIIVLLSPECKFFLYASITFNLASSSFVGKMIGCFAMSLSGALCILPLLRSRFSSSTYNKSCFAVLNFRSFVSRPLFLENVCAECLLSTVQFSFRSLCSCVEISRHKKSRLTVS